MAAPKEPDVPVFKEPCDCPERQRAEAGGRFVFEHHLDGWVFADGPMRKMTAKAAYWLGERGGMNHTGEPYTHVTCPFCGKSLRRPENPFAQPSPIDGEEGG